jgi:hypothetical protein
MEMTEHEDWGLIYSTPCHAVVSEVVKALKTAKLLFETQVLSDLHFIKYKITHALFIRHCQQRVFECIEHMGVDAHPIVNTV